MGIWALRTVNGDAVPAVLSDDGTTQVSIRQALLFVDAGGGCIINATYVTTTNGTPREEEVPLVCGWEQSGSQVAIAWPGGEMSGMLTDTFLTLTDDDGHEYVYERT